MAQTQLNRVYVQTIDSTGTTDPTLSLGVKSLTTTVKIGGIGTGGNSINVSSTGINMSGPLNALGQTNLQNTSILNVGITGQTTLENTSINGTLNVAGLTTLINVSTTSLSVLNNVSVGGNVSVKGNLYVSSNMILPTLTVGSNAVLENASIMGTLKATKDLTTLKNVSINETLDVVGLTTLNEVRVNGGTNFYNSVGITDNTMTFSGTGGINVAGTGLTTLQNTSILQGLTVGGNTSLSKTEITGATDINLTGSATTTIGNSTSGTTTQLNNASTNVSGTLTVTGQATLQNVTIRGTLNVSESSQIRGLMIDGSMDNLNTYSELTVGKSYNTYNSLLIRTIKRLPSQTPHTLNASNSVKTNIFHWGSNANTLCYSGEGNLGIGFSVDTLNDVPSYKLDVNGTTRITGLATLSGGATVTGTLGVTGATTLGVTGTGALTAASLSVTGNETVTGTLGVTGATTLSGGATVVGNSKIGNWFMYGNSDSNSLGTTNLTNQFALYQSGGETVLNANNTNSDGLINFKIGNTTRMGIQNTPVNTSNNNTTSSVTNSASNIVMETGASLTNAAGVYTYTTTGAQGVLDTKIYPIQGVTYKTTFIVKSDTAGTSLYFDQNNSISLFDTGTLTNTYRTFVCYHTAINNNRLLIVVSGGGKRIQYTHLSVEPFYNATTTSLSATSLGATYLIATGKVGFGTTTPLYNFDVGSASRIKGLLVSGSMDNAQDANYQELSIGSEYNTNKAFLIRNIPGTTSATTKSFMFQWGNNANAMCYVADGRLGIGFSADSSTLPLHPLHVATNATGSSNVEQRWFNKTTALISSTGYSNSISIYATNSIMSDGSLIASDRRIKTNILDIDDDRALRDLRLLKPKTYTYKDVIRKGSTPVYGFIAQEVKEVLNYSSNPMTETIPNIYETANFVTDTLTLTFNTADLSRDASGALFPKLKLKTKDLKDEFVNIVEVIDEHTIKVDKDLTEWGGQLDASGQVVPGDKIFVYGQEVNDFHNLNKDAIWTIATAALQEVDRQLQAEKQKTAALQTAFDALLERVVALEQKSAV